LENKGKPKAKLGYGFLPALSQSFNTGFRILALKKIKFTALENVHKIKTTMRKIKG
jgi:hypothetical protein